ncbi:LOW QUALITY PROTEIN: Transposable element P transposase [Frankliniella fusca]|uniref:Transposable element P transposase n=1 Tax=Frankliniella fusca TaxID=407009 RepID=A0AAE1I1D7_9NEOP|nr:LOW QUALITY PROTEIN: Transposable element P transposase [Frankliniella fusca]
MFYLTHPRKTCLYLDPLMDYVSLSSLKTCLLMDCESLSSLSSLKTCLYLRLLMGYVSLSSLKTSLLCLLMDCVSLSSLKTYRKIRYSGSFIKETLDATQPLTVDVSVSPSPSTSKSSLLSPSSTLVCTSGDEPVLSQTITSTSETQRSGHIIPSDQDISDDIESDCTSSYVSESVSTADERSETPVSASATTEDVTLTEEEATDLIMELKTKVDLFLPCNWICVAEKRTVHLVLLSRNIEKSIQRRIGYRSDGELTVSVHGKAVDSDRFLKNLAKPGALCRNTVDSWVDFLVSLLNEVRGLEICSGIDFEDCVEAWDGFPNSYIDKNFFKESRYINTLRMNNCKLLVEPKCWRCVECSRAAPRVKRKMVSLKEDEFDIRTANIYLSTQKKLNKLKKQTQALNACKKKIERLQEKVQNLIEKEGVYVEDEMCNLMHSALKSSNLSPFQELFIQQQFKAASCKSARGMRWHPQMIRFALSIFLQSPSTYNILVDSKMIRLPHSRTLFDYSHCFEAEEGICNPVLESIHKHICEKAELKHKWHVLMCDEMHISKNIVYNRSTGELVGYTKITEVEKCLNEFQSYLDNTEVPEPDRASKMLSFMVKGVCNGVKEVVASYSVNRLSKEKLYSVTWNVIAYCERTGIQIIAFTSDGNASNRAFFKMNTAISPTKNGVVYDTINKAAPSRPFYFISDLPHLVKTIRNNFFNSRIKKGSKRCLTKNGEKILWSTIIRLFKKNKTLRKAYKLSAANVYLDYYSVMKVKNAFQVLSNTVSCDLQAQGWEKVSETVKFIKRVNDFADCLNGAHSSSGSRSANPLLNPYTDPNDSRFTEYLLPFLDYLEELTYAAAECLMRLAGVWSKDFSFAPSKHILKSAISFYSPSLSEHHICPSCSHYVGKFFESIECSNCFTEIDAKLNKRRGNVFLYISVAEQIKSLFIHSGLFEKLIKPRLRQKIKQGNYEDIFDGKLYKDRVGPDCISFNFFVDGLQVRCTSKNSAHPVLFTRNELPIHLRRKHVMMASVLLGKKKPVMNEYLKPFVRECIILEREGISFKTNGVDIQLRVIPLLGDYGCGLCYHPAFRMIRGRGHSKSYSISEREFPPRTHEETQENARIAEESGTPQQGIKGHSILTEIPGFDIINCLDLDLFHALVNCAKIFTNLWLNRKYSGRPFNVYGRFAEVDRRLLSITPTDNVPRNPRSLLERSDYRGHEWFSWVVFYSIPVLTKILPNHFLSHWALSVHGIVVLMQNSVSKSDAVYAGRFLRQFNSEIDRFYGAEHVTFSTHLLTHLEKSTYNFGQPWTHSAFVFENFIGEIKAAIHGSNGISHQIIKHMQLRIALKAMEFDLDYAMSDDERDFLKSVICSSKVLAEPRLSVGDVSFLGDAKNIVLSPNLHQVVLRDGFQPVVGEEYFMFDRCIINNEIYQSVNYSRKQNNSIVLLQSEQVFEIHSFIVINNVAVALGHYLVRNRTPLCNVSLPHIKVFNEKCEENLRCVPVSKFDMKLLSFCLSISQEQSLIFGLINL